MIFYPVKRPDGNRGREQIQNMVYFIGAGPGDPELLTIKGKKIIDRADVIIYAGSLVNPQVLADRKPEAVVYDSAGMHLDQVIAVMEQAEKEGLTTARVHTGDPAIYGAHREQMDRLEALGIPYEIVPGVSSFLGAASALHAGVYSARREPDSDPDPDGGTHPGAGAGRHPGAGSASGNHGDFPERGTDSEAL